MNMKPFRILILCLLLLTATFLIEARCSAQAFCALRDPTAKIYESYPTATSYRSLVRTVDENIRQQVARELPFNIHFNELGRHTLYLAVKESQPVGLVHARSEAGNWGLTEIVWSLTPNLTVEDFSFQRCRSRKRSDVETAEFKRQLQGKSFRDLKQMLNANGTDIVGDKLKIGSESRELAAMVVRSALKTILVSKLAWAKELSIIQPLYFARAAFDSVAVVEKVEGPYTNNVLQEFSQHFKTGGKPGQFNIKRDEVLLLLCSDKNNKPLGYVVRTPWKSMNTEMLLWWTIRNDNVVKDVVAADGWPDEKSKKAFQAAIGLASDQFHKCSTAAELSGAEVLLLCKHN